MFTGRLRDRPRQRTMDNGKYGLSITYGLSPTGIRDSGVGLSLAKNNNFYFLFKFSLFEIAELQLHDPSESGVGGRGKAQCAVCIGYGR